MKYSVGLDLGGTKLAAALVDEKGNILSFRKESVLELKNGRQGPQKVVDFMASLVADFAKNYPKCFKKNCFMGVGLASAGPLNVEKGALIHPVNFPNWNIVPIQDMLKKALAQKKIPAKFVAFQNDAIAASFAEAWIGGARDLSSFAVVTIGTGIGTGVIFKGQPVQTAGMGSEFGHLIIQAKEIQDPKERSKYTVEGIASGTGILRRAKEMGFTGSSVEELVIALESGETKYQILFEDTAQALAALCYNLSIGFHVEKILVSGGLIKVRRLYWTQLKKHYEDLINDFNPQFKAPIQVAKALNQAGVLGAAYLPYLRN